MAFFSLVRCLGMKEQINNVVLGEYFIGSVEPYLRSAVAQLVEC